MAPQVNVMDSLEFLVSRRILTPESATALRPVRDRAVDLPSLNDAEGDVLFACLLLDSSCSMAEHRKDVVEAQHAVLDVLRGSVPCRKRALYVSQYLFNNSVKMLQEPALLAPDAADDGVMVLSEAEYAVEGRTVLYQTVHHMLQDLTAITAHSHRNGLVSRFIVWVFSDGDDTEGGVMPDQIWQVMDELRGHNYLLTATLIGFESSEMPAARFVEMQKELGFDQCIIYHQDGFRKNLEA